VTIEQYRCQWRRFSEWAGAAGIVTLRDVTPAVARQFAADLWADGVSAGTFNKHVGLLRSLWATLSVPCGLRDNPWAGVRRVPSDVQGRREFSEDQLRAICGRASGAWRCMVGIGLYTALRLGDVACLPWSALDLEAAVLCVIPSKTRRKGPGAAVTVPLHRGLVTMLRDWRAVSGGSEWVFPEQRSVYLGDRSVLARQFGDILRECGIATREDPGEHRARAICRYGFHSLRHSFVSICRRAGVAEMVVMELVGHGSPAMTRLYTHGTPESRAAAIATLPALAN
jgi:integrase